MSTVRAYLFGFLDDDFFGRVVVVPTDQTVATLAAQLAAWGPTPERRGRVIVTDESGAVLDPAATVAEAGLVNGDIFTVTAGG
ncbi:MAG TPA: EsaB/YukD family protein [Mycobacteriales bacterium]|nr:EsaB/YukD family protein [Mycobacteriales bacterium]